MVSLVVGYPGSGKSYYAVHKIYNILTNNDPMSKDIDIIYTNINGIKFDMFPDSKIEFKKFNTDEFYIYLKQLYTLYEFHKNSDSVDDELIKLSKKLNYHRALIVFDECHDFFSNQDKYKIFWLTYHRHIYHEIILLTQNKSLIFTKYRAIPEIFVEAQPRSKKLSNNSLSYKKYVSFAMRKADMFETQSIKARSEVFALYQSGNKSNQKSVVKKYLIIFLVFLVLAFITFYLILQQYKVDEPPKEDIKKVNEPKRVISKNSSKRIKKDIDNNLVISIFCDNKKGCIIYDNSYSLKYVHNFLKITKSKKLNYEVIYRKTQINQKVFKYIIHTSKEKLSKYFIMPKEKPKAKKFDSNFNYKDITDKVRL